MVRDFNGNWNTGRKDDISSAYDDEGTYDFDDDDTISQTTGSWQFCAANTGKNCKHRDGSTDAEHPWDEAEVEEYTYCRKIKVVDTLRPLLTLSYPEQGIISRSRTDDRVNDGDSKPTFGTDETHTSIKPRFYDQHHDKQNPLYAKDVYEEDPDDGNVQSMKINAYTYGDRLGDKDESGDYVEGHNTVTEDVTLNAHRTVGVGDHARVHIENEAAEMNDNGGGTIANGALNTQKQSITEDTEYMKNNWDPKFKLMAEQNFSSVNGWMIGAIASSISGLVMLAYVNYRKSSALTSVPV